MCRRVCDNINTSAICPYDFAGPHVGKVATSPLPHAGSPVLYQGRLSEIGVYQTPPPHFVPITPSFCRKM